MRRLVLVGACTFLVGALAGTGAAKQAAERGFSLEQPSEWVAFTADVAMVSAEGRRSGGRFYRNSDGSTRSDMVIDYGEKQVSETRIENFRTRTFYINNGREVWLTGALEYPELGFLPQPWSSRAVGLVPYARKVALLKGQDGSLTAAEGLNAWMFSNHSGVMRLMVPELNFFAVYHSRVTGYRRIYSNIELRETDDAFFHPPATAVLEQLPRRAQ